MTNTDPTRNFVVFLRGDDLDDAVSAGTTAREDTAVRRVWQELSAEQGVRPGEITGIFALWEPSRLDAAFIRGTFGEMKVVHQFDRPGPDDWDAAFARAREVLEAEAAEADEQESLGEVEMPILRSASLSVSDSIKEMMPWVPVAGDDVYATIARVGRTPHGTIGMVHLLNNQLGGEDEFAGRMADAIGAMATGLQFGVGETEDGTFGRISRSDGINAAAAIMLPRFHSWIADSPAGWTDFVVLIPCPDFALVAETGSAMARKMANDVREFEQQAELLPSLLRVTAEGMALVAEGGR
ncbi:hypothetical protein [Amycolatopsis sp.]|uniref:hypothetical protein n=1 Tax=Amycolatopsis sp. TaxID=37632 RepID=UPI002C746CBD|nr:hypothetical protein [Amycolatopsis sp.]HVV12735.1 hypothetical protein [Amycolatopsis sp.]